MTEKTLFAKLKTVAVTLLALVCAFCICAFCVACNDNSSDTDETTYNYSETDTKTISNAKFAYGTYNKADTDFPFTSPTGWSRAADNSAPASAVNSGVVSTYSASWDKTFDTLYSDTDFKNYLTKKFENQAIAAIRAEKETAGEENASAYNPTDNEKKDYYKQQFVNPGTRADATDENDKAEDTMVYMLNNYRTSSYYGWGTAQRILSSTTVSVKKGETYEISVWVKTLFVTGAGANIRITGSVNGNTQAEFRINGIKDTAWTKYTVYFRANADYDCSFTIMLGLGYGSGIDTQADYFAEGTVFFDDVTVAKANALPDGIPAENVKKMQFGEKETQDIDIAVSNDVETKGNVYCYEMEEIDNDGFFNDLPLTSVSGDYTVSTVDLITTSQAVDGSEASYNDADGKVTLTKASYTLALKNGANDFVISTPDEENDFQKFTLVSFKIKNNLNELGSTDITVFVCDEYNGETAKQTAATFSTVSDDFEICNIIVNNNYPDQTRNFYIEICIGPLPDKVLSTVQTAHSEFASGTVEIAEIKFAEGFVSSDKYDDKTNNPLYKLYSFYSSDADANVEIHAGYPSYSSHDHTASYSLNPVSGAMGQILNNPAAVKNYYGINPDHIYLKDELEHGTLSTYTNERLSFLDDNDNLTSYAGLINTEYMSSYRAKDPTLETVLSGLYDENKDEHIQPLVVYNNTPDHYGFVGKTQTVSASSCAKVTLKIKIYGEATANVYLVDVSGFNKNVMQFADYDETVRLFALSANATTEVGEDGWVTLSFYLATGASSKSFRVEIWNGQRDGAEDKASAGYVIVNSISVSTSSGFSEPERWADAFSEPGNPLFDAGIDGFESGELIRYTRELTETEKQYNKEYPKDAVSYDPTYIWANNDTMIYGVFNTIDPVEHNPYDDIEEEETGSGCQATSDPSAFWMSFSSILLAVALILSIIALFIKNYRRRRRNNKSDAKSQYKVKSRTETQKAIRKLKEKAEKAARDQADEISEQETDNTAIEDVQNVPETENDANATEGEPADDTTIETDYVYGDVQDFGDMTLDVPENTEKPEEDKDN